MGVAVGGADEEKQRAPVQGGQDEEALEQSLMALSLPPVPQGPTTFATPVLDAQNASIGELNAGASALGADSLGLGVAPQQTPLGPAAQPAASTGSAGSPAPAQAASPSGPATATIPADDGLDWFMEGTWDDAEFAAELDRLGLSRGEVDADPMTATEGAVREAIGDDWYEKLEPEIDAVGEGAASALEAVPVVGAALSVVDDLTALAALQEAPDVPGPADDLYVACEAVADITELAGDTVQTAMQLIEVVVGTVAAVPAAAEGAAAGAVAGGIAAGAETGGLGVGAGAVGGAVVGAVAEGAAAGGAAAEATSTLLGPFEAALDMLTGGVAGIAHLGAAICAEQAEQAALAAGDLRAAAWYGDAESSAAESAATGLIGATVGAAIDLLLPVDGKEAAKKIVESTPGEWVKERLASAIGGAVGPDATVDAAPLVPVAPSIDATLLSDWAAVRGSDISTITSSFAAMSADKPGMTQQLVNDIVTGSRSEERRLSGPSPAGATEWLADRAAQALLVQRATQADDQAAAASAAVTGSLQEAAANSASLDGGLAAQQQAIGAATSAATAMAAAASGAQEMAAAAAPVVSFAAAIASQLGALASVPVVGGRIGEFAASFASTADGPLASLDVVAGEMKAAAAEATDQVAAANAGLDRLSAESASLTAGTGALDQLSQQLTATAGQPLAPTATAAVAAANEAAPGPGADPYSQLVEWAQTWGKNEVGRYKGLHAPHFETVYVPATPDAEVDALRQAGGAMIRAGLGQEDQARGREEMAGLAPLTGKKGLPEAEALYEGIDEVIPDMDRLASYVE